MKRLGIFSMVILLSLGFSLQTKSLRLKHFNLDNTLALAGYDPVAYFLQKKAVKGRKELALSADGVIYHFSSESNKDLFQKNYSIYEPQYGGWCAYAMGNSNEKVEIDPKTFKLINGKLYLFYNAYFNNTLTDWNKDEARLLTKADKNWSAMYK